MPEPHLMELRRREVDACLARGVLYGALAQGLQPPAPPSAVRRAPAETDRAVRAAARLLDGQAGRHRRLESAAVRLGRTAAAGGTPETYQRLFGHTAQGAVPAFETEYGASGPFRGPQELADLNGFYRAFGLRPRAEPGGRGDHVGCECEFLGFLCRKEAWALGRGDEALAATTRLAYRSFLRDHLGRFGRAFAVRLAGADPRGPYAALAGLLEILLTSEARRLGIPAGPEVLELRTERSEDAPLACGPDPACGDCPP